MHVHVQRGAQRYSYSGVYTSTKCVLMNLSSLFFFLLLGPFIFPNSPPPIFGTQACVRVSVCTHVCVCV